MSSYQVRARSGTPIADDFDSDIPPLVEDFDTGRTFSVTEAGVITLIGPMNQAEIGFILYPQTAAEIAAGVTPTNYVIPSSDAVGYVAVARYGTNTTPGTTDMTTAINNAIKVASNIGSGAGRVVKLNDGERHKTTAAIIWYAGVSIEGGATQTTVIVPTMSSGIALDASKSATNNYLYNQWAHGFVIDGTNLSGTARALSIKNGNRTQFKEVQILNCTGTSVPAMLINGAGYHVDFFNCVFSNNARHWEITKNGAAGDFPTDCLFDRCLLEGATSAPDSAMIATDASFIKLRDCTVQGNASLNTLVFLTTTNQVTTDYPEVDGGWWEDNGGGQAGSVGILLQGVAGRRLKEAYIHGVTFHQSVANKPNFMIGASWTDGLRVENCVEAFGAGAEFVHDYGNNINFWIEHRRVVSTIALKSPILWGTCSFNGKAGIAINSSYNLTPTRTGAGAYTITFVNAPPATGYVVQANAEDGSTVNSLVASPGLSTSTVSFTLAVTLPTTNAATDGRTINVTVWAIPA